MTGFYMGWNGLKKKGGFEKSCPENVQKFFEVTLEGITNASNLKELSSISRKSTFDPFQPSVSFHITTSQLICIVNQINGFYMKNNNGLQWVKNSTIEP